MKTAYLDGGAISGKRALHETLAEQLGFPSWYGRNLDAMYDLLTAERTEPVRIVIRNRAALEESLGGYFRLLLAVLEDAALEGAEVRVEIEGAE